MGIVNKIIPMSVVDGPGNRTAIFFQGCNFNCLYCHNPETINHCIHCGKCVSQCPSKALEIVNKKVIWKESKCIECDKCIDICPFDASPKVKKYSPQELAKEVEKNIPFIQGVTTSGGECTLQYKFLLDFFREVHKLGLTCLADTNGSVDFSLEVYKEFVEETDGFMLDIKAWDRQDHIGITGQDNDIVVNNLEYLFLKNKLEEVRCVCLESLDNKKTIQGIFNTLSSLKERPLPRLKLISYRHFGVRKQYQSLRAPELKEMKELVRLAKDLGFLDVILI